MKQTVSPEQLIEAARAVREQAFAPHTGVKVGAALLTADGQIVTGCNIESPSGISHVCAERCALFTAMSQGHRHFTHVAVIADFIQPIPPCGACRQALVEFSPELTIIMANTQGESRTTTLSALLPESYRIEDRRS